MATKDILGFPQLDWMHRAFNVCPAVSKLRNQCSNAMSSCDCLSWSSLEDMVVFAYPTASKVCSGSNKLLRSVVVTLVASTVVSSQEIMWICYFQKDVILLLQPSDGLVWWSSTYRGYRLPDSKWNSVFVVLLGLLVLCVPVGFNLDVVLYIMFCSFESELHLESRFGNPERAW